MLSRSKHIRKQRSLSVVRRYRSSTTMSTNPKFLASSGFIRNRNLDAWKQRRNSSQSALQPSSETPNSRSSSSSAVSKPNPLTYIRSLMSDDTHPSQSELESFSRDLASNLLLWTPAHRLEWLNHLHSAHCSMLRSLGNSASSLLKYDRCVESFLNRQRGSAMPSPFVRKVRSEKQDFGTDSPIFREELRYHWLFYVHCSDILRLMQQMQRVPMSVSVSDWQRTPLPSQTIEIAQRIYNARKRPNVNSMMMMEHQRDHCDGLFKQDYPLSSVLNEGCSSELSGTRDFEFHTRSNLEMTNEEREWASLMDACHRTLSEQMMQMSNLPSNLTARTLHSLLNAMLRRKCDIGMSSPDPVAAVFLNQERTVDRSKDVDSGLQRVMFEYERKVQSRREEAEQSLRRSLLDSFQQEYLAVSFDPVFFEQFKSGEKSDGTTLSEESVKFAADQQCLRQLQIVLSHVENAFSATIPKGSLTIDESKCPRTGRSLFELRVPVSLDSTVSESLTRQLQMFAWFKRGGGFNNSQISEENTADDVSEVPFESAKGVSEIWDYVESVQRRCGDLEIMFHPSETFRETGVEGSQQHSGESQYRHKFYSKWRDSVLSEPVFSELSRIKPKPEAGEPVILRLRSPLETSVRELLVKLCDQSHFYASPSIRQSLNMRVLRAPQNLSAEDTRREYSGLLRSQSKPGRDLSLIKKAALSVHAPYVRKCEKEMARLSEVKATNQATIVLSDSKYRHILCEDPMIDKFSMRLGQFNVHLQSEMPNTLKLSSRQIPRHESNNGAVLCVGSNLSPIRMSPVWKPVISEDHRCDDTGDPLVMKKPSIVDRTLSHVPLAMKSEQVSAVIDIPQKNTLESTEQPSWMTSMNGHSSANHQNGFGYDDEWDGMIGKDDDQDGSTTLFSTLDNYDDTVADLNNADQSSTLPSLTKSIVTRLPGLKRVYIQQDSTVLGTDRMNDDDMKNLSQRAVKLREFLLQRTKDRFGPRLGQLIDLRLSDRNAYPLSSLNRTLMALNPHGPGVLPMLDGHITRMMALVPVSDDDDLTEFDDSDSNFFDLMDDDSDFSFFSKPQKSDDGRSHPGISSDNLENEKIPLSDAYIDYSSAVRICDDNGTTVDISNDLNHAHPSVSSLNDDVFDSPSLSNSKFVMIDGVKHKWVFMDKVHWKKASNKSRSLSLWKSLAMRQDHVPLDFKLRPLLMSLFVHSKQYKRVRIAITNLIVDSEDRLPSSSSVGSAYINGQKVNLQKCFDGGNRRVHAVSDTFVLPQWSQIVLQFDYNEGGVDNAGQCEIQVISEMGDPVNSDLLQWRFTMPMFDLFLEFDSHRRCYDALNVIRNSSAHQKTNSSIVQYAKQSTMDDLSHGISLAEVASVQNDDDEGHSDEMEDDCRHISQSLSLNELSEWVFSDLNELNHECESENRVWTALYNDVLSDYNPSQILLEDESVTHETGEVSKVKTPVEILSELSLL